MDERIAKLNAIKCPGRTNTGITDPLLRREFARELNDWRNQMWNSGTRLEEHAKKMLHDYSSSLYNGFWAMQKAQYREFAAIGKRVVWALIEAPEPDANYLEYEQKVVELYQEIEGMKEEARKTFGGMAKLFKQRDMRLKKLQVKYGI